MTDKVEELDIEEVESFKHAGEMEGREDKSEEIFWDIPPLLDPENIVTKVILEKVVKDRNTAQIGDVYLERAQNIPVVAPAQFTASKSVLLPNTGQHVIRQVEVEIPDQMVTTLKQGYKVWIVLQPKWSQQDQERLDKIHQKYAAIYHNKEEYKCFYEQKPSSRWPKDRFPNGKYWTERWIPRIWNEEKGKWLPADERDCQNWDSIPEDKKRVDFLYGVLPEDYQRDEDWL